jgi:TolB protein
MRAALYALVAAAALCLATGGRAQSGLERFDSREAFTSAARGLSTVTFDSAAPARGFARHRAEEGLTLGGATFRARGGAKFGAGQIYVVSADYGRPNPLYNTGTLPVLSWAAPNRPGNASLDVTLPAGTTAVGCDLWTQQPYAGTVEVVAATADGREETFVVSTLNRPAAAFVGFISDADIVAVSFRPPEGQTGLLLDNFTYGRRADGRAVRPDAPAASLAVTGAPDATAIQSTVAAVAGKNRPAPNVVQTSAPPAGAAQTPAAAESRPASQGPTSATPRGTIAYVRGGTEIRLVEADGTGDRQLWTHPFAKEGSGVNGVAWRPDGKELAFSSGHLSVASVYHADIYAVGADGKNLRKITNAPEHSELARFPQGSVSLTVSNEQSPSVESAASAGVFFVYVAGAAEPQQVTLPPGSSKTLLFKAVADFGARAQQAVAVYGPNRWVNLGVDVRAGATVKSELSVSGDGYELYGAFRPVWRGDGSRISYRSGVPCIVSSLPARPAPGEPAFNPLFAGKQPVGACAWDWGPTPALADQLIYTFNAGGDGSHVFRVKEGGAHPGVKLHTFSELDNQLLVDLRWLPDGSGFLYSFIDYARSVANVFRYDLATKRLRQLTSFEHEEYTRAFDISPDGEWVVYERAKDLESDRDVDLWLMRSDGSAPRLLVKNGFGPSWR